MTWRITLRTAPRKWRKNPKLQGIFFHIYMTRHKRSPKLIAQLAHRIFICSIKTRGLYTGDNLMIAAPATMFRSPERIFAQRLMLYWPASTFLLPKYQASVAISNGRPGISRIISGEAAIHRRRNRRD